MKKLFAATLLFFFLFFARPFPVAGREWLASAHAAGQSAMLRSDQARGMGRGEEMRFLKLFSYLNRRGSPLADYSWFFIRQADRWGVDWRLLPAISGIESSFGQAMVPGSFNAYGWGGGYIKFAGWRESIDWVNWSLRTGYYNKGLVSPEEINSVWAPPSPHWGRSVASIMTQISAL